MSQDFHAAPKTLRVSCRYSNGTVASYVARAVFWDDPLLHVLSSQAFEPGVQLSLLAEFMGGIRACRVTSVQSSKEQPGYFEIVVKLLAPPPKPVTKAPEAEELSGLVPAEVVQAGREFASALESRAGVSFGEALETVPPHLRRGVLVLTAAALAMHLQDNRLLDVRHMIAGIESAGKP